MTDLIQGLTLLVLSGGVFVQIQINIRHRESIKLLAGRIDILKEYIDNINSGLAHMMEKFP